MPREDWICSSCEETIERRFAKCWNCGAAADGTLDPDFHTVEQKDVASPNSEWRESVRGLWILALLMGLMAAYMASRQRSSLSGLIAVVCFGYVAIQATAWLLVRTAGRMRDDYFNRKP